MCVTLLFDLCFEPIQELGRGCGPEAIERDGDLSFRLSDRLRRGLLDPLALFARDRWPVLAFGSEGEVHMVVVDFTDGRTESDEDLQWWWLDEGWGGWLDGTH